MNHRVLVPAGFPGRWLPWAALSLCGLAIAWLLNACMVEPAGKVYSCVRPEVIRISPEDGQSGVPRGDSITITFGAPVDSGSLTPEITLLLGPDTVPGTITYYPEDTTVVFVPDDSLLPDTTYTVIVGGVEDTLGIPLDIPYGWTFTTEDTIPAPPDPPEGVEVFPKDGSTDVPLDDSVTVTFDGPMDSSFFDSTTVIVTAGPDTVPGTITYYPEDTTVVFVPDDSLLPSTTYTVTVTIPTDSTIPGPGGPLGPPTVVDTTYTWTFSTKDSIPKPPEREYPSDGMTNVPHPKLWWYQVPQVVSYHLQISTSPLFTTLTVDADGLTSNTSMISFQTTNLAPATTYYWRVSCKNSSNSLGPFSTAWSFVTAP